jgi:hypothetical protein
MSVGAPGELKAKENSSRWWLPAQPLPDLRGEFSFVQRVEVQPRRTPGKQTGAQFGDNIQTITSNRARVVSESLHSEAKPAWNLGSASVGETHKLGEISDGHNSRNNRNIYVHGITGVNEATLGINIVEVLGDG